MCGYEGLRVWEYRGNVSARIQAWVCLDYLLEQFYCFYFLFFCFFFLPSFIFRVAIFSNIVSLHVIVGALPFVWSSVL